MAQQCHGWMTNPVPQDQLPVGIIRTCKSCEGSFLLFPGSESEHCFDCGEAVIEDLSDLMREYSTACACCNKTIRVKYLDSRAVDVCRTCLDKVPRERQASWLAALEHSNLVEAGAFDEDDEPDEVVRNLEEEEEANAWFRAQDDACWALMPD